MSLLELFCEIDDFWQVFEPQWHQTLLTNGQKRRRYGVMSMSEMMTIVVHFHQQRYRDFKTYYTEYVAVHLLSEFPKQFSYNRFVQLMPRILVGLCEYLRTCYGRTRGIAFIDSTALAVCHNRRIKQHRVFDGVAQRGRTSVDWFYGFKLHLIVNDCGEVLSCCVTAGNVDDRHPVPKLVRGLWGKLFGDKGYLSRPLANLLGGLIAYCHQPKKPSLNLEFLHATIPH